MTAPFSSRKCTRAAAAWLVRARRTAMERRVLRACEMTFTSTTWTDTRSSPRTTDDTEPSVPSALGITLDPIDETPPTLREGEVVRAPHPKKADAAAHGLAPGSRIGDYIVGELIATGGFGS